ncbi:hypothetical protein A3A40_01560 [Candidatus Kaiserbacteria bacterium RIFCSPLOWO2_01_FULL_54_20]|uniref:DUF218 domain-containing protein n=1 Tax=Candidatus Kaiserbacteria bacterium RIFCSPLOWO2_01_FULL_54_20 TaxID=1798513 RepID=A0A1F6EJC7_9BACT|nr:MAG: hypothetical protein A3A40_01560 [Candidatus Kaiserbacteria bacterium RIFCSPLOWO2_01_FULL_54_20]
MTPREKFIALVSNDTLEKADAIIILEGDLLVRVPEGARLYKEGWAPIVVISGGDTDQPAYAVPASQMLPALLKEGVPREAVILEEKSQNTRDQAVEIMKLARERGWKSIILVASHYHQYRAFLTFLKAMREAGLELALISAPVRDLRWWEKTGRGLRIDNFATELKKIDKYREEQGHVASYEEGIQYLQWKESQRSARKNS